MHAYINIDVTTSRLVKYLAEETQFSSNTKTTTIGDVYMLYVNIGNS